MPAYLTQSLSMKLKKNSIENNLLALVYICCNVQNLKNKVNKKPIFSLIFFIS